MKRKRVQPTDAQIVAVLREVREKNLAARLRRAAATVRAGKPVDEGDRDVIGYWLDKLGDLGFLMMAAMGDVQRRAHIADHLQRKTRMPVRAAARILKGKHRVDAVVQAVYRLRRKG